VPVLCGASFKNKGVQALLDAVIDYLPAPDDVPPIQGTCRCTTRITSPARPRTTSRSRAGVQDHDRPVRGAADLLPVYSGKLTAGSYVYNASKDKKERIGRLLQMHANKREEIEEVLAGDIAAAIGLKDTRTGDTLCDEDSQIILEAMKFPNPVIDVAIEPKTRRTRTSWAPRCRSCRRGPDLPGPE